MRVLLAVFILPLFCSAPLVAGPQRIVSTFVGGDEIIWELLKGGGRKRIAALSSLARDSAYSSIAHLVPKNMPLVGASNEFLLKLRPDFVIAASYTRVDVLDLLVKTKTSHLVLNSFKGIFDIKDNIRRIGIAIDRQSQASRLLATMNVKLKQLAHCGRGRRFLNFSEDYTLYGADTTFDGMIQAIGGENMARKLGIRGWSKVGLESLVGLKPDVIVVRGEPTDLLKTQQTLRKTLGWQQLTAVKSGQVTLVPGRFLVSVSHSVVAGAALICQGLMP